MGEWGSSATALDGGLRREAFFVSSQGQDLFASMYMAVDGDGPGLLICPSWGFEMAQTLRLCHALAHGVARLGGAGMVLQWPGHGDSDGDLRDADVWRLATAASDALAQGRSRSSADRWALAGVRLGAAAAWLGREGSDAAVLVLVQPALNPAAFLRDLQDRARRAGLDRGRRGWAYGEPLPDPDSWPDSWPDLQLAESTERFAGKAVCVRYADDPAPECPAGLEHQVVRGSWRRRLWSGHPALLQRAESWVRAELGHD